MTAEPYYSSGKHGYMKYASDSFPQFTFEQIKPFIPAQVKSVIELGAGMGRFSGPLVDHYAQVDIVEPAPAYVEELKSRFSERRGVEIFQADSSEYISTNRSRAARDSAVFCFHLLHHLTHEQRNEIYRFIRTTGALGVFVEPNPINPLILIQVLTQPDMKFSEEQQYLKLGKIKYAQELAAQGLCMESYRRICLLPPFLANRLLEKGHLTLVAGAEKLRAVFSLFCSYQVIVCRSAAH
jgi:hypothetical protein